MGNGGRSQLTSRGMVRVMDFFKQVIGKTVKEDQTDEIFTIKRKEVWEARKLANQKGEQGEFGSRL